MNAFRLGDVVSSGSAEDQLRFKAFSNYIAAIALLFDDKHGSCKEMLADLSAQPPGAPPKIEIDRAQVSMLLRRAWSTEMLLALPLRQEEMKSVIAPSALWLPVQTYYAVHSALNAVYITRGATIDNHTRAQNHFSKTLLQQVPFPLNCSAKGHEIKPDYGNFSVVPDKGFSNLRYPQDAHEAEHLLAIALRTTRRALLIEKYGAWKERNHRKQISATQKLAVSEGEPATNILHYLYRLRIRSNYGDSEMFVTGPSVMDSIQFTRQYVRVADYIIGALEVLIARRIGMQAFLTEALSFYRGFRSAKPPVFDRWSS